MPYLKNTSDEAFQIPVLAGIADMVLAAGASVEVPDGFEVDSPFLELDTTTPPSAPAPEAPATTQPESPVATETTPEAPAETPAATPAPAVTPQEQEVTVDVPAGSHVEVVADAPVNI